MSFSNVLEGELLDHLFDIGSYAAPTIYVGLSTADPGEDASGLAEPVGGGYARVACAAWSRATSTVDNDAAITFPEATGNWGNCTYFALFDAITAGNMLASAVLTDARNIVTGQTPRFSAGELDVTLT